MVYASGTEIWFLFEKTFRESLVLYNIFNFVKDETFRCIRLSCLAADAMPRFKSYIAYNTIRIRQESGSNGLTILFRFKYEWFFITLECTSNNSGENSFTEVCEYTISFLWENSLHASFVYFFFLLFFELFDLSDCDPKNYGQTLK